MFLNEAIQKKWAPVLDHKILEPIADQHRRSITAIMLENTQNALREATAHGDYQTLSETTSNLPVNNWGASSSTAGTGSIDTFDPILISLVRRAMPNLIAYDICGVQPMTGPTGLIFAMRSRYESSNSLGGVTGANARAGSETFYNEVNTAFSTVTANLNTSSAGLGQTNATVTWTESTMPGHTNTSAMTGYSDYQVGIGMSTAQGEALGTNANSAFPQMGFSIEKVPVTAVTRAMKAEYTMELAQDLKAIHGLDAETELSNILSGEILAEINREVVRTINITAVQGCSDGTTSAGVFDLDTDSNGRWLVEKFKGLMFRLDLEANQIARQTRRGKGNIVICSADVASALNAAGMLVYNPKLADNLQVDDTGNTFAGVLNGRYKVYIDPYAIGGNYMTLGYKGSSAFDAGLFYCPYVPLQMVRAVDQDSFQPKIGFKTRYGMVANPFAQGITAGAGALTYNTNVYYRRTVVNNLM